LLNIRDNLVNFKAGVLSIIPHLHGKPVNAAIVTIVHPLNIDPCHICNHRSPMNDATSLQNSFFIRRHAVQQLLRQALTAEPKAVFGLLGGRGQHVEAVLALHNSDDAQRVRLELNAWEASNFQPIATYSSQEISEGRDFPDNTLPVELIDSLSTLPRLAISTDTKGRIEATLLSPAPNGQIKSYALEMQEDGGLYPLGDRG